MPLTWRANIQIPMNEISEFFAANGINPFLAGLILGAIIWALIRSKASTTSSDPNTRLMTSGLSTGFTTKKAFTENASFNKINLSIATGADQRDLSAEETKAIVQALKNGDKINAIKIIRAATGLGLKDAKEVAEGMQRSTV